MSVQHRTFKQVVHHHLVTKCAVASQPQIANLLPPSPAISLESQNPIRKPRGRSLMVLLSRVALDSP